MLLWFVLSVGSMCGCERGEQRMQDEYKACLSFMQKRNDQEHTPCRPLSRSQRRIGPKPTRPRHTTSTRTDDATSSSTGPDGSADTHTRQSGSWSARPRQASCPAQRPGKMKLPPPPSSSRCARGVCMLPAASCAYRMPPMTTPPSPVGPKGGPPPSDAASSLAPPSSS